MYFIVKIKRKDAATETMLTENLVLRADTYTEAETRAYTHYEGESVIVDTTTKKPLSFVDNALKGELWFEAKVIYVGFNEALQKETKTTETGLISSEDFIEAYNRLLVLMDGTVSDWRVASLKETNIHDSHLESEETND